jgi:hypothetical protein
MYRGFTLFKGTLQHSILDLWPTTPPVKVSRPLVYRPSPVRSGPACWMVRGRTVFNQRDQAPRRPYPILAECFCTMGRCPLGSSKTTVNQGLRTLKDWPIPFLRDLFRARTSTVSEGTGSPGSSSRFSFKCHSREWQRSASTPFHAEPKS